MDNYQNEEHNLPIFPALKVEQIKVSPHLANSESVRRVCASLRPLEKFQDPVESEQLKTDMLGLSACLAVCLIPEESVHPHNNRTEQGLAPSAAVLQPDVGDVCGQNAGKY